MHQHECPICGARWLCADVACEPECRRCQDELMAEYLMARDYHITQLPLPELVAVEDRA